MAVGPLLPAVGGGVADPILLVRRSSVVEISSMVALLDL